MKTLSRLVLQLYHEIKIDWQMHPARLYRILGIPGPPVSSVSGADQPPVDTARLALVTAIDFAIKTVEELAELCGGLIKEAIEMDANLVVFPPETGELLLQLAPCEGKRVYRRLQAAHFPFWSGLARKYQVWLIAGCQTLNYQGYNRKAAFLFGPQGQCGKQYKVHLTVEEKKAGYLPGREVQVWPTAVGPLALCFYGEEQYFELGRIIAAKGGKILVSLVTPGAALQTDQITGGWARAQENPIYFVGGTNVFAPTELSIDGSGIVDQSESSSQRLILVNLDLTKLTESDQGPMLARRLCATYLPRLYFEH